MQMMTDPEELHSSTASLLSLTFCSAVLLIIKHSLVAPFKSASLRIYVPVIVIACECERKISNQWPIYIAIITWRGRRAKCALESLTHQPSLR